MIRYISGFGDFCEGPVLCYCFGLPFLFVMGGAGWTEVGRADV